MEGGRRRSACVEVGGRALKDEEEVCKAWDGGEEKRGRSIPNAGSTYVQPMVERWPGSATCAEIGTRRNVMKRPCVRSTPLRMVCVRNGGCVTSGIESTHPKIHVRNRPRLVDIVAVAPSIPSHSISIESDRYLFLIRRSTLGRLEPPVSSEPHPPSTNQRSPPTLPPAVDQWQLRTISIPSCGPMGSLD